jgi:SulP family sulfate permease
VSTAIWSGLFTAAFGGCVYNIVGPTGTIAYLSVAFIFYFLILIHKFSSLSAGALSGILARNVSMYGVDSLPYLAILTGIICLIVFLLKWERYVLLVPSSVMEGFTVGVAFIIALNQVRTISSLFSLSLCVCVCVVYHEPSRTIYYGVVR